VYALGNKTITFFAAKHNSPGPPTSDDWTAKSHAAVRGEIDHMFEIIAARSAWARGLVRRAAQAIQASPEWP
jgi:hypothetical protein